MQSGRRAVPDSHAESVVAVLILKRAVILIKTDIVSQAPCILIGIIPTAGDLLQFLRIQLLGPGLGLLQSSDGDTDYGPEFHLFDQNGTEILFPEGIMPYSLPYKGVLIIKRDLDGSEKELHPSGWGQVFGLGKPDGTVIVEPKYDYLEFAGEGLFSVYEGSRFGVMDASGRMVVYPRYDMNWGGQLPLISYHHGYAVIDEALEDRCILLDREGRELYSVPSNENGVTRQILWVMSNQCFWVRITAGGVSRYQLMKIEDGRVIPITGPDFEKVGYSCSPDSVLWNNENELSDELIPAGTGQKCGYIDGDGAIVIPFEYDTVMHFYHGLALVEKDGKLMYIDHSGAVVWQEK